MTKSEGNILTMVILKSHGNQGLMGTKKPRHLFRLALKKDIIDGEIYYVECIGGIFVENKIDIGVFEKDLNGKKYDKFEVRRNLSNYRNFFYSMIDQGKLFVNA